MALTIQTRHTWLCRIIGIMGLLLFGSTWKLWSPQSVYPQIPFFEFLVDVPGLIDWMGFTGIAVGLCTVVLAPVESLENRRVRSAGFLTFVVSTIALILLDQHRLQPWAYQLVVFSILIVYLSPKRAFFWLRLIIASIYIYSATSKADFQFIFTVGDQFLNDFFLKFGINTQLWPEEVRRSLTLAMPLTELFVGIGLVVAPLRKAPAITAIVLHLLLILLLSGSAAYGVLIWNVFFIATIVLLFLTEKPEEVSTGEQLVENNSSHWLQHVATGIAVFVLAFPLTRAFDFCDHWPAWELYAPRTSRATLQNSPGRSATNLLPDSIELLGAPVYPEDRFQLGVAIAVLEKHDLTNMFVVVAGVSDRWTGERKREVLFRRDQMQMRASQYLLNTKPRNIYFDGNKFFNPPVPIAPTVGPTVSPGQKQ